MNSFQIDLFHPLIGTTTPGQSGSGSNVNERVTLPTPEPFDQITANHFYKILTLSNS